jgi:glycosyltransferase involved in cell wall biosynthesis
MINLNTTIFVDCHIFDKNYQGTTTYIKGIYTELIKDKNKHFFLGAANIDNLKKFFGNHSNVTYIQLKYKNKFVRLLFEIPKILKANNIDYAHFQYIAPPIKVCKYIVTIHDVLFLEYPQYFPYLYRIKNKALFYWSAKHADIVCTVSEFSKQKIKHYFNINSIITPNAVDPVFYESYDKKSIQNQVKTKFTIEKYWIYVSRWEPRKNHLNLVKVFAEKEYYKEYKLLFIGDKDIPNKLFDDYFDSLPAEVQSKIIIKNKVNFPDLLLLLRGATLSVYPSFAEGFGIPPLESLAAQIPTVCSNTTAMADFDFLDKNLFNPYNLDEINQRIKQALSTPFIEDIVLKIEQKYNWSASANVLKNAIVKKQ